MTQNSSTDTWTAIKLHSDGGSNEIFFCPGLRHLTVLDGAGRSAYLPFSRGQLLAMGARTILAALWWRRHT